MFLHPLFIEIMKPVQYNFNNNNIKYSKYECAKHISFLFLCCESMIFLGSVKHYSLKLFIFSTLGCWTKTTRIQNLFSMSVLQKQTRFNSNWRVQHDWRIEGTFGSEPLQKFSGEWNQDQYQAISILPFSKLRFFGRKNGHCGGTFQSITQTWSLRLWFSYWDFMQKMFEMFSRPFWVPRWSFDAYWHSPWWNGWCLGD